MSFRILDQGPQHQVGTKMEDGRLLVKTVVHDEAVLANNHALRQSEAIRTGDPTRIGPDGAEYVYGFQVEPHLWKKWKKDNPETYRDLTGGNAYRRERAAAYLARTQPQWTLFAPKVTPVNRHADQAA
jgi:hypothetical protein